MKVKELARQLGKPVKELILFLEEVDVHANSGSTKLDAETVETVRELFRGERKQGEEESLIGKTVHLDRESITVKDLTALLKLKLPEIMKVLLEKGLLLNLNSEIDILTAAEIAEKFDITLEYDHAKVEEDNNLKTKLDKIEEDEIEASTENLTERPPVITIMGHVDHGKTLLLDTIRKSNIVGGEAGGITQHIGAYQIEKKGKKLTFLDTPGHEAFTSLRARGAQVTDIAILVVAADEGIKPQTIEAIDHAKAANVPIIVAINKMDKPGADVDRVKKQLAEKDLLAEDWGGKTIMAPISAKKNEGIGDLLDLILLTAEVLELRADATSTAKGIVIESQLSKQRGPVASVLIKSGTLHVGDIFSIGATSGKVRAMLNDHGKKIKIAPPGTPVELLGISEVPEPGSILEVHPDEKTCRLVVESRQSTEKEQTKKQMNALSLKELSEQVESGEVRKLSLIIKSDVNGSLDAIIHSIQQIPSKDVSINVIHSATGPITESDIMLARASSALVLGFNVNINNEADKVASNENVDVKTYNIIYEMIDDIEKAIKGLFKKEFVEVDLGEAEVRQIFKFSKVGNIAGCSVKTGVMKRNALARVKRGGKVIFEGKLTSLKRFQEDVKEVKAGYECGIVLDGFSELNENDLILCYELQEKK